MTITDLVQNYKKFRDDCLDPGYNETQLRTDFLDPLFELLGWDLKNSRGKATNEREVLVEEGLRDGADSNTKKPDYTFRLFAERKFFLEAKKPSVKISKDPKPARQVRRYGFTAKLKISVLSNFEYLAIYDCSNLVDPDDQAEHSRIRLYHYTEYEDNIEEIKQLLSRDSVYTGIFDDEWKEIEAQIKLQSVDDIFLKQINTWRLTLGLEIYSHNSDINNDQLNDWVQRYINSIIFLRVCEDRNLEDYATLLNFATKNDFQSLIAKFKQADKKFNAGLFNHPFTADIIKNSSSAFWTIIKQLYFPESTYSFSVFGSDILGNIYETYLSEQLVIENKTVSLVKKAENIDRDVVTTPTYIIQDILKETLTEFCEGKNDHEILDATFADISCGSGAFLLETFQLLHDTLVDYYLVHKNEELIPTGVNSFKLNFKLKRQILSGCIYGVDKDYNAVQACKFGLLLKLLENEDNTSISSPALPSLDENIYYGNSLLNPAITPDKYHSEINPFDFGKLKFDVIVGNPPYMATEHMKEFTPKELKLYKNHYVSSHQQFDKYYLFIEQGLQLLKPNGYLGYILPSKFCKVGAGTKLRELLATKQSIHKLISFGANQVFQNKTTYTCLLILRDQPVDFIKYLEVYTIKDWRTRNTSKLSFDTIKLSDLNNDVWVLVPGHLKVVYNAIKKQSISLKALISTKNISNGIQTSANQIYIHTATKEDKKYLYFSYKDQDWQIEKKLTRPYYKTLRGPDNLYTYRPLLPNSFVIYPYLKTDNGVEFVKYTELKKNYPRLYDFLNQNKDTLTKRDIKPVPTTKNEWYRYGRQQSLNKCDVNEKIVVGVLAQGNKYAVDLNSTLISSGGTAGYCMITLPEDSKYSIYYIQALLTSKYLEWFASLYGEIFNSGYIARGTKVLKNLPIHVINFDHQTEAALHDTIADLQKELISIQRKIDENIGDDKFLIPLRRKFKRELDKMNQTLAQLFNLGKQDLQIPLISELYAAH